MSNEKLIIESIAGGVSGYFYEMWKAAQSKPEPSWFEQEYPIVFAGIDWAKPGSERTVEWSQVGDLTLWTETPSTSSADGQAMEAFLQEKRNEHIWDMIVLAAESARYGK